MGKKGRWRIVGYDGAGEAIRRRSGPRVEPERQKRADRPHRESLRDMFEGEDRAIKRVLGVNVR